MSAPRRLVERWTDAMTRHDREAAVACFHPDYEDVAPARLGEEVRGVDEVRRNFRRLLETFPDLRAEVLSTAGAGDELWMEWRMSGTRPDGSAMAFVGVNIFDLEDGLLRRGRIYTDLVRDSGTVEAQVGRMTGPPSS
ncbi:MAG: nuclear transport factor 2 family protein [Actinobacteria bacterium]|nr:nuclear transport factor 2 family protein [Actinomycetota bacterium]